MPLPAHSFALAALLTAATATAQDLLHYKFDDAYGTKVVNYAAGSLAPSQGTIVSSLPGAPAASWAPGRFGAGALAGSIASPNTPNRLDTGWVPGTFTGSLSYALWIKLAYNQAAPSLCYLFGSPTSGQFRAFTGTSGIWFTSGAGFASQSTLANVYNLANGNWLHLAFVADAASMTATYYLNGVAEPTRTITVAPTWTSPVPFTVGQQLVGSPGSIFDIDEFLLANRAMTAAEIAALAMEPRAGNAGYGSGCGPLSLGSVGGVPALGNLAYALELASPTPAIALLGIGSNRASWAGQPLPFDLGSLLGYGPCTIDSSFELATLFAVVGPQPAVFGMPILPSPVFLGTTFYAQAPGLIGGSTYATSNAFAIAIGG
jgi:hypothetical protein